ncbi:inactive pancreatic lipase-related protein 1-like [Frankliniella occidentalis]|uniref:Inactive pancreatic lipase-related protein 1-like n=1 Tax=Frankliniella occidentalis TaxID=133901 RepID=A0A6J1S6V1_FRAOC|nr:inactive pancreatic lipase-related protein 1-like [Frankliniella occidentalis]
MASTHAVVLLVLGLASVVCADTEEGELQKWPLLPHQEEMVLAADVQSAVKFYLITDAQPDGVRVDLDREALLAEGFNASRPSVVIVHGYGHDIRADLFAKVAGAYLQADYPTNVLGVDWGELCPKPKYIAARSRVAAVGARVADLLDLLLSSGLGSADRLHLVGHSLGAHVVGNAAKRTRVARITGLDPAQPLFFNSSADRLGASDADLVDVVHTCVGLLGYRRPLGHVDFYPNGGTISQPGCGIVKDRLGSCSHLRSYELFAESIVNPEAFPATQCGSLKDALRSKCSAPGTANMGQTLRFTEPGLYSLQTRGSSPFSLG